MPVTVPAGVFVETGRKALMICGKAMENRPSTETNGWFGATSVTEGADSPSTLNPWPLNGSDMVHRITTNKQIRLSATEASPFVCVGNLKPFYARASVSAKLVKFDCKMVVKS